MDFCELARERFRDVVQPIVRSDAEVDRIWRWLRQKADRIVILADGLEEAFSQNHLSGERDGLIRKAIRKAGEEEVPLVIASRPHDPLRAAQAAVSELEPLSDEAALHYIARNGSWRSDATLLDRVVEAANMAESPTYLQIAKDLHRKDLLEPLWTGGTPDLLLYDSWALRVDLLERWIDALIDGKVHPELPIDHDTRRAVVEYISALACIGLASDRADVELRQLDPSVDARQPEFRRGRARRQRRSRSTEAWNDRVAWILDERIRSLRRTGERHPAADTAASSQQDPQWEDPKVDVRLAATWGTRMGLVFENGDRIQFQHSIIQAYLGSRFMDEIIANRRGEDPTSPNDDRITKGLRQGGKEMLIALTLYSRSRKGKCTCTDPERSDPTCPVSRMRTLLMDQAKDLLDKAQEAETITRRRSMAPQSWAVLLDDRGSTRLRVLEIYGAAVEIDSVQASLRNQEGLLETLKDDWVRLGKREDPARLRDAKLAVVRQCGSAARRVAAVHSGNCGNCGNSDYKHAAYKSLFEMGRQEPDRCVREAIVKEIGAGGGPAYRALCQELAAPRRVFASARKCKGGENEIVPPQPPQDDRGSRQWRQEMEQESKQREMQQAEDEARKEKELWFENTMCAWLLPLLVDSSLMSRHLGSPRDDLENWVLLATQQTKAKTNSQLDAFPGSAISLSAALAQGFKYAANRRLSNRYSREFLVKQAQDLLKHSTFWYTRLTLVQALTLWALPDDVNAEQPIRGHGSNPRGQVDEWLRLGEKVNDEHPLVKAAGELAVRALQTRRPERFLWIDEAAIATSIGTEVNLPAEQRAHNLWIPPSTGWSTLDPMAQQLLADTLLLTVLGERAYRPKDLFRVLDFHARERTQIPSCVSSDRTRLDPVRGAERTLQPGFNCTDECRLRMCPYPGKVESLRIEFSEVFCLHQRNLLNWWRPRAWLGFRFRREAWWQHKVPVAGMRRFWDRMSNRARDLDPEQDAAHSP